MTLIKNENILTEALDRLIFQYKEKPAFENLISALAKDHISFEESVWRLFSSTSLSQGTGVQLDIIGEILGILRLGRVDSVYRTRLIAAVIQYTSSGRWEQLIEGFRLLTGARSTQGEEIFPASVSLTAIGATNLSTVDLVEIADVLRKLKAAGIGLKAALIFTDPPFVFAGDPDIYGTGFADANNYDATGGYFPLTLAI